MDFAKLVKDEISGSSAKSFVAQISQFHRIQGSTMFHEAAQHVRDQLQKMGFKDARIMQFPADGKTKYWTHRSPTGWEVKSAELRMIEPEEKQLANYEDTPQSLHAFSNGTPPDGVSAELVEVGAGTKSEDYKGKNVRGKFVLATGRARLVHEHAVHKFGAAGVITDTLTYEMPNVRESLDVPDAHAYQSIWPRASELSKAAFGFSLSKRQGNVLRAYLKDGKTVRLKAKVDARLFPFYEEVITATVKGKKKPEEEIFLVAHLCHPKPSANDNASGSGLLLEIARTIKTLIRSRKISPPMRTIRFIWVPETLGTVAYISSQKDLSRRMVAGLNLDMVGQNQELCHSTLNLDRTPDSLPSYLNDFVFSLIEQTVREFDYETRFGLSSTFRYRTNPFSGGSDHAEFTEATTHVPCVMLLQWPDLYYHTSLDTIDKVSEDSLKRVGWIATLAVLTLANAGSEEALFLADQTASKGMIRIHEAGIEAARKLSGKNNEERLKHKPQERAAEISKEFYRYKSSINHIVWRETQAVRSVERIAKNPQLDPYVSKYCKNIIDLGKLEIAKVEEFLAFILKASNMNLPTRFEEAKVEKEMRRLVPKRLFKGSLSMDGLREKLGSKDYEWYDTVSEKDLHFGKKMIEIINFMDGKRNALEIARSISVEYGLTDPEHVRKFLRDLEKTRFIEFR
jgi:hypothetical protein